MHSPFSVRPARTISAGLQTGAAAFTLSLFALPGFAAPPSPPALKPPAVAAPAKAPVSGTRLRYTRELLGADGTLEAFQTAIRRFDPVSGAGPSIYLVAASHLGEKPYYEQLQKFLDKQDVVLYEGVHAPRTGAKAAKIVPQPSAPTSTAQASTGPKPVSIQRRLSDVLHLQFQLDAIRYDRPGFRNSDLDWESMNALAAKAGGGTQKSLTELKNTLSGGANAGATGKMLENLVTQAGSDPAMAAMLRRMIVSVIANPEKMATMTAQSPLGGSANLQTILITERNKAVLADLKTLLATPKNDSKTSVRSVALFYGAAHMEDMGQQLINDLGYRAADTQWLTAFHAVEQTK